MITYIQRKWKGRSWRIGADLACLEWLAPALIPSACRHITRHCWHSVLVNAGILIAAWVKGDDDEKA